MIARFLPLLAPLLCAAFAYPLRAQNNLPDGVHARFNTSLGSFVCRLEYERAPRTVANFVGLAEGSQPFIDFPRANVARRPFFNGISFHRVIDGFVIQAGSPNAQGTDGPGYQFADEFHPQLRHSRAGILSMANSGPNSNGSQFFVTLASTSHLDNKHSVFGDVVDGMPIVQQIGKVPVGANDRPLQPVVIQNIQILRIGAKAQAYNPATILPRLPTPQFKPAVARIIAGATPRFKLQWTSRPNCNYQIFATTDFKEWEWTSPFVNTEADFTSIWNNPANPFVFFSLVEIAY